MFIAICDNTTNIPHKPQYLNKLTTTANTPEQSPKHSLLHFHGFLAVNLSGAANRAGRKTAMTR